MTMTEIRNANAAAGNFFFNPDTMRFFKSRVSGKTYVGHDGKTYFVTSETGPDRVRRYTVRATADGVFMASVPEFQAFASARTAHAFAAAR